MYSFARTTPDNILYAPVYIRAALAGGARMGEPTDEELTLINRVSPTKLKRAAVFSFPGIASTNALDTYFTHMRESSLRRIAKSLMDGSALLDSHDVYRLPIGSSYYGEVQGVPGGMVEGVPATMQVPARFYMLRNLDVPGSGNTDSYIAGITAGMTRKLSIGFGGADMRITCDQDGSDLYDWDSDMWPGKLLDDGSRATYGVDDADHYETSLVYKNATPGAIIRTPGPIVQRWQALFTEGRIKPAEAARLEQRTGFRFADPPFRSYPGIPAASPLTITEVGGLWTADAPRTHSRTVTSESGGLTIIEEGWDAPASASTPARRHGALLTITEE